MFCWSMKTDINIEIETGIKICELYLTLQSMPETKAVATIIFSGEAVTFTDSTHPDRLFARRRRLLVQTRLLFLAFSGPQ